MNFCIRNIHFSYILQAPILFSIGNFADPMTEGAMILTRIMSLAGTTETAGYGPVLGVLLFLWALGAGLALGLIAVSFAPDHASLGGSLHQLNDLLPADPRLWSEFTA